jgi:hypothetical protein
VCQEREISEGVWPGSCRSLVDDDVLSSSSFTGFSVCPVVYDGRLIAHKGGVSGGPLGDSRQQQRPPCCARLLLTFFNTSRATRRFHVPTFISFYFGIFQKNKSLGLRVEWSNGRLVNQPNPKSDEQPELKSVVLTPKGKGSCGLGYGLNYDSTVVTY